MSRGKHKKLPAPSLSERADYYDLETIAKKGFMLPRASAMGLEEALLVNSEDVVTRARMLGYYSVLRPKDQEDRKRIATLRLNHVLWFIQNAPDCKFAGDTYLSFDKEKNAVEYDKTKRAWFKQAEERSAAIQTTVNAAMFFFKPEPTLSKRLLKGIAKTDPDNAWVRTLLAKLDGRRVGPICNRLPERPASDFDYAAWQRRADQLFLDYGLRYGEKMQACSIENLEKVLARHPEDMAARAELVGYYGANVFRANVICCDPDMLQKKVRNVLWFIQNIPGSKFAGDWGLSAAIDQKIAKADFDLVKNEWLRQTKISPKNPMVLVNAAKFFCYKGQFNKGKVFAKKARKIGRIDKNISSTLEWIFRKRKLKFPDPAKLVGKLDEIAVLLTPSPSRPQFGPFTFAEWAKEIDLDGAHLYGIYHWVPGESIANLEKVMSKNSLDIFNRAKMMAFYERCYAGGQYRNRSEWVNVPGMTRRHRELHINHVRWFIENVPQSRVVAVSKCDEEAEPMILEHMKCALQNNPDDLEILVNLAYHVMAVNKEAAKSLVQIIMRSSPFWGEWMTRLLGEKVTEVDASEALKALDFRSGKKNANVSRIARQVDLLRLTSGTYLPKRTIWSNELALQYNPNDILLRAELLESYNQLDQFRINFGGSTPDVVKELVRHNVWFIEHTPDEFMYSQACCLGDDLSDYLGDHKTLLTAAKAQMKAYPKSLRVALAMAHYFPLGQEIDSIKALKEVKRLYPKNKELQSRLKHLNELLKGRVSSGR